MIPRLGMMDMDGIAIFMLKIHKIATNIPKKITAQILIVARVYLALVNIAYKIWIDKQVKRPMTKVLLI